MNANLLKMMREKLDKEKQEPQPIKQQNVNSTGNNVQKVEKQKQQQQIALANVQHKHQPVQSKVNEGTNQTHSQKQTQQIMKNTQLYEKLMSLKGKLKKKDESGLEQKQPDKNELPLSQKPIVQVQKESIPVTNQNNQETKAEVKPKQLSLKLMMQKLKKSKPEQSQTVQKPQQNQVPVIQSQKQATVNQSQEEKRRSVELNLQKVEEPQAIIQQPIIKSSSALDQGQRFPWAKSVNIPVCESNVSNQNDESGKSQNPVEQILEIIKKASEQNFEQSVHYIDPSEQNYQQQEEEQEQDPPLLQQEKILENQPEQRLLEPLPIQCAQQEEKPLQILQAQPIQTQQVQQQEKQKPREESKVMQKLNTMLQNLKKMKEMKQNKNKQADQAIKAVTYTVQNNLKRNEAYQLNQVINVSKAEENLSDQQDQQQQQNLQEEDEQEEDEQEEDVNEEQRKVFSKQQQKRTKIFMKQIGKIGEITSRIRTLINQKYQSHLKIYPSQSTGLVDLFKKIQFVVEK